MTPAYKWLVQNDYKTKLAKGLLSARLASPTITSLREECVELFKKGVTPLDRHSIHLFFGGGEENLLQTITDFDRERLKPLQNFFKGGTEDPNYKIVGLAAWLIDFKHRPYSGTPNYDAIKKEVEEKANHSDSQQKPTQAETEEYSLSLPKPPATTPPTTKPKYKRVKFPTITKSRVGGLVGLFILCYFLFWLGKNNSGEKLSATSSGCMYWTGDHYEPIPCHQKIPGAIVVALDSQRLKEFKRVTRPDTITYASIGRLFYYKPRIDSVDFYTADGQHPTQHDRYVRRVTKHMIDKYVLKKTQLTARD